MRPLLLIAIALLVLSARADGSCVQESLSDRIARAEAIAVGTVSGGEGPRNVFADVSAVYKGSVPARILIALGPGGESGPGPVATSVDYRADRGTTHTFYLRQHAPAGFSTDACSGSHEGDLTTEERASLGEGRPADRVPTGIDAANDMDRLVSAIAVIAVLAAAFLTLRWAARTG